VADIPAGWLALYQRAATAECDGLPWTVLAAIGKVESDHGRSTLPGVHSAANTAAGAEVISSSTGRTSSVIRSAPSEATRPASAFRLVTTTTDPADPGSSGFTGPLLTALASTISTARSCSSGRVEDCPHPLRQDGGGRNSERVQEAARSY